MTNIDFNTLSLQNRPNDWHAFYHDDKIKEMLPEQISHEDYQALKQAWATRSDDETAQTDWLILLFNHLYQNASVPTTLVRGAGEPEYFAPKEGKPARIEFAHGFFQSALHEISHWCVAGAKRRQLDDFGYWYCPDGRDEATQRAFEQVEITPQAIECLLSLALGRTFYVSADNLNANFDTSNSTFGSDVYERASAFLTSPHHSTPALPTDAKRLIWVFLDMNFNQ